MQADFKNKTIISTSKGFKILGGKKVYPKTVKGLSELTGSIK